MRLVLNVAEKPAMARQIAAALSGGAFDTENGKNKYCKNYHFEATLQIRAENSRHDSHMIMTSVLGHITEIDFKEKMYADWQNTDPGILFNAEIESSVTEDGKGIAENLRQQASRCAILVIWTDCDREGEYIGWEIVQACQNALNGLSTKPSATNRRVTPLTIYRARYSSMSRGELERAFVNAGKLDMRQVNAVRIRMELDLRSGAAFTRLQTLGLRRFLSEEDSKSVLSYGSCQFPTLGFVVEQYERISKFRPEAFWTLNLVMSNGQMDGIAFAWKRVRIFDRAVCAILYEKCLNETQPTIRVTKVESKAASKWRPVPLRTVELQKMASIYLKIPSDTVMSVAESLYTRGYISYPRTETDIFSKDFQFRKLLGLQREHPQWGSYAEELLGRSESDEGRFKWPRPGKNDDKAHPPIHPTKAGVDLSGTEAALYDFITRRFLACCSDDARGFSTKVDVVIGGSEEFSTNGLQISERNFLEVYGRYDRWNAKEIGTWREGFAPSGCRITSFTMDESKTIAPKLLSEAELIASMDRNGIGTDATIHEHIKKILDRKYAMKTTGAPARFHPTNLGVALVSGYDRIGAGFRDDRNSLQMSLTRPMLRAKLERDLMDVCRDLQVAETVLRESVRKFAVSFEATRNRMDEIVEKFQQVVNSGKRLHEKAQLSVNNPETVENPTSRNNISNTSRGGGDQRASTAIAASSPLEGPPCRCGDGKVSGLRTVAKPGQNLGKRFWGCLTCKFFEWVDSGSSGPAPSQPLPSLTQTVQTSATYYSGYMQGGHREETQSVDVFQCDCGQAAVSRTVQKDGQNKGRSFWTCSTRRCDFFEWNDSTANTETRSNAEGDTQDIRTNAEGDILCHCGLRAVTGEATSTANRGRPYMSCSRTVRKCPFFIWLDGESGNNGSDNQVLPSKKTAKSSTRTRGTSRRKQQ